MEELEGSAQRRQLARSGMHAGGRCARPGPGERVRRAVDAQLRRAGVAAQDAGDVRTEVVLALLSSPAADLPLPLELVCARAAVIARNKAIDLGRRSARAPIAFGDDLPEPDAGGSTPGIARGRARRGRRRGSPAAGAERTLARARKPRRAPAGRNQRPRRRRCGPCLRAPALDLLPRARACPGAAAERAPRPPRGPRRSRRPRPRRSIFAHAEARTPPRQPQPPPSRSERRSRSACRPAEIPRASLRPFAIQASGGRVHPVVTRPPAARSLRRRVTVTTRDRPASSPAQPAPSAAPKPRSTSCTYDPSAYDC